MWVDLNVAPAAPLKRGKGGLTFCMKWWAENLKSPRVILMMLIFLSRASFVRVSTFASPDPYVRLYIE